jgi:hypothetical protein
MSRYFEPTPQPSPQSTTNAEMWQELHRLERNYQNLQGQLDTALQLGAARQPAAARPNAEALANAEALRMAGVKPDEANSVGWQILSGHDKTSVHYPNNQQAPNWRT